MRCVRPGCRYAGIPFAGAYGRPDVIAPMLCLTPRTKVERPPALSKTRAFHTRRLNPKDVLPALDEFPHDVLDQTFELSPVPVIPDDDVRFSPPRRFR